MKDLSFGQYYPADSFVHRLDARFKLCAMTLFIVMIFFIQSYFGYVVAAVWLIAVVCTAKIPFSKVLASVRRVLFLVLFTAALNLFFIKEGNVIFSWWIINITDYGADFAAKMTLRLIMLVLASSFLTLTTTPMALTDGLESLLAPLKLIRFPVRDMAMIMSIALRFIPSLTEETRKIMNAQKARGASFDTGGLFARAKSMLPVLIPLFVNSFRRADELALAMDARCYSVSPNRTRMRVQKFSWRDGVGALFTLAVVAVIFLDRYLWQGVF